MARQRGPSSSFPAQSVLHPSCDRHMTLPPFIFSLLPPLFYAALLLLFFCDLVFFLPPFSFGEAYAFMLSCCLDFSYLPSNLIDNLSSLIYFSHLHHVTQSNLFLLFSSFWLTKRPLLHPHHPPFPYQEIPINSLRFILFFFPSLPSFISTIKITTVTLIFIFIISTVMNQK